MGVIFGAITRDRNNQERAHREYTGCEIIARRRTKSSAIRRGFTTLLNRAKMCSENSRGTLRSISFLRFTEHGGFKRRTFRRIKSLVDDIDLICIMQMDQGNLLHGTAIEYQIGGNSVELGTRVFARRRLRHAVS